MTESLDRLTDRRAFIGGLAATTVALASSGLAAAPLAATTAPDPSMNDAWLKRIAGKHRQVFDAVTPNDGWPLGFAQAFLDKNRDAYGLSDRDLTAVVGLRHFAIPLAFTDPIWAKYKFGDFFKVNDKATNAPATRNVFAHVREGDLPFPGMSVDELQRRGVIFTVCNHALTVLSGLMAKNMNLPADDVRKEWIAGLMPGMVRVPAGVLAVNRAQEHGCSYCYAG